MVPFPKMQFLSSAYSPFTISSQKIERKTKKYVLFLTVCIIINLFVMLFRQIKDELFVSVCSRNNELLKIDSTGIFFKFLFTKIYCMY